MNLEQELNAIYYRAFEEFAVYTKGVEYIPFTRDNYTGASKEITVSRPKVRCGECNRLVFGSGALYCYCECHK